jgi:hypothetical protein
METKTTLKILDLEVEVEFDYQPEEKPVRYYSDYSGYPGCAESLEIHKVLVKGTDISDLIEHFDLWDKIETMVYENKGK